MKAEEKKDESRRRRFIRNKNREPIDPTVQAKKEASKAKNELILLEFYEKNINRIKNSAPANSALFYVMNSRAIESANRYLDRCLFNSEKVASLKLEIKILQKEVDILWKIELNKNGDLEKEVDKLFDSFEQTSNESNNRLKYYEHNLTSALAEIEDYLKDNPNDPANLNEVKRKLNAELKIPSNFLDVEILKKENAELDAKMKYLENSMIDDNDDDDDAGRNPDSPWNGILGDDEADLAYWNTQ